MFFELFYSLLNEESFAMYKNMFFMFLVTTFVVSCSQNSIDPKIKELKDVCLQKAQNLSDLGAKITEKQDIIEDIVFNMKSYLPELVSTLNLDGQEKEDFIKKYINLLENFGRDLDFVLTAKKAVKGFLVKELFNEKAALPIKFDKAKFYAVRLVVEYMLLKNLVEVYEEGLQELINIDQDIDILLAQQVLS